MLHLINQDLYPTEFGLHRKYAQSAQLLDLVWTHCHIISDIVDQLLAQNPALNQEIDATLTRPAALLHDIGVYECGGFEWLPDQPPCNRSYAQHTIVGAWILEREGWPPEIVQTAETHAGVGLTKEDILTHGLDLPPDDYLPITPLQRLVTYAAKFHSKAPRFKSSPEIKETLARFGDDKVKVFAELEQAFSVPDLSNLEQKYQPWHQAFQYSINHLVNPGRTGLSSAGISRL